MAHAFDEAPGEPRIAWFVERSARLGSLGKEGDAEFQATRWSALSHGPAEAFGGQHRETALQGCLVGERHGRPVHALGLGGRGSHGSCIGAGEARRRGFRWRAGSLGEHDAQGQRRQGVTCGIQQTKRCVEAPEGQGCRGRHHEESNRLGALPKAERIPCLEESTVSLRWRSFLQEPGVSSGQQQHAGLGRTWRRVFGQCGDQGSGVRKMSEAAPARQDGRLCGRFGEFPGGRYRLHRGPQGDAEAIEPPPRSEEQAAAPLLDGKASLPQCIDPRAPFRLGGEPLEVRLLEERRGEWSVPCSFRGVGRGGRACAEEREPRQGTWEKGAPSHPRSVYVASLGGNGAEPARTRGTRAENLPTRLLRRYRKNMTVARHTRTLGGGLAMLGVASWFLCVAEPLAQAGPQGRREDPYRWPGARRLPRKSRSIGWAWRGRLVHGVAAIESSFIHHVDEYRRGGAFWGTWELVQLLERAAWRVHRRLPGARLSIGELSKRGGGRLKGHHSHQSGRDVDIAFYMRGPDGRPAEPRSFVTFDRHGRGIGVHRAYRFDDARNWELVAKLVADGDARVQFIFVASTIKRRLLATGRRRGTPRVLLERAAKVMVQPREGHPHRNHFHVRIYCSPGDRPACKDRAPFHAWYPGDPPVFAALR